MPPKRKSKRQSTSPYARQDTTPTVAEDQMVAEQLPIPIVVSHRQDEPQVPRLPIYSHPQGTDTIVQSFSYNEGVAIKPILSACQDIGLHISMKLREKIWNGEFVDLGELLNKDPCKDEVGQKLVLINGEIVVKQKSESPKIENIEAWTNAFIIYASIFLEKHPDQVQGIFKYMHTIRLAATRLSGQGWKNYDIQFRLRKAMTSSIPWGTVDGELWLMYMNNAPLQMSSTIANTPVSTQPCFDFNYKGVCLRRPCRYIHKCINCSGNHAILTCFKPRGEQPFVRSGIARPFQPRGRGTPRFPRFGPNQRPMGPW